MKAMSLARAVDRLVVVDHAIARYLARCEGASPDEIKQVLDCSRQEATEFLGNELERAVPMSTLARRIFIHPDREGRIGTRRGPAVDREGEGSNRFSRSKRRDSQYFWTGYAAFVIEHNVLMTVVLPDSNQLETLRELMPEVTKTERQAPSLLGHCRGSRRSLNRDSGVHRVPRKENFRREAPPLPRWQGKDGAVWTVFILPEKAEREELRKVASEVRKLAEEGSQVFVETSDAFSRKLLLRLSQAPISDPALEEDSTDDDAPASTRERKGVRVRDLPPVPQIEWRRVEDDIPTSARRWWSEMLKAGEAAGKLLTLVTPMTAKAILEIADGSSWAPWRRALREGRISTIAIAFRANKAVLSYT